MKVFLTSCVAVLFFSTVAVAGPFLVCDPYPEDSQPTHYQMHVDGTLVTTPYGTLAGGASVVLDLQGYSTGPHQITDIQACNARGCSDPPLVFAVPGLPGQPKLRLVP